MKRMAFFVALLLTACDEYQTGETRTETPKMSQTIPGKTITIDQLEAMFENIAEKTDWDLGGKMLWGYFFTHREPKALEPVRDELITQGYRFVDLYQSDAEDQDGPPLWWLHVESEEVHTPHSLDQRNDRLYLLAARHGVDSYDGMDVGPIQNRGEAGDARRGQYR